MKPTRTRKCIGEQLFKERGFPFRTMHEETRKSCISSLCLTADRLSRIALIGFLRSFFGAFGVPSCVVAVLSVVAARVPDVFATERAVDRY